MKPYLALFAFLSIMSCKDVATKDHEETALVANELNSIETKLTDEESFNIIPISHATMILKWDGVIIYVDPVGGTEAFNGQPKPDIVLITDIHGDHLNLETLAAVIVENTHIIAPKAVADKLPDDLKSKTKIIANGENSRVLKFKIGAIPMYNLRPEALKFHAKGRGNGYVIEKANKRIYISGDTEDIPEMRELKNIDMAFVCMNLPYTMTVESAADAVLAFKPKTVYPYHYRGTGGLSDVSKFKKLVNAGNSEIKIIQLDWYPQK